MREFWPMSLAAALLAPLAAAKQGQDVAYLVRWQSPSGTQLVAVDPWTGVELHSIPSPGAPWYVQIPMCLTHDGVRVLGYSNGSALPNAFRWIYGTHPATGRLNAICMSLLHPAAYVGVEIHPQTGACYVAETTNNSPATRRLFTVDLQDGMWSLVGNFNVAIGSIAINSTGGAFGFGAGKGYSINLATAVCTLIGTVGFPGNGTLMETAFDSQGNLWGLVWETVSGNIRRQELYLIDTATMSTTYVCDLPYSAQGRDYNGLAFGPGVTKSTYCTAKVNSLGCSPAIAATGYPSASAEFGFTVSATQVGSQSSGMLVYSVQGAASTPFAGGTLCVQTPWQRTAPVSSGGPAPAMTDCSGVWSRDFNAWLWTHTSLPPGLDVYTQWLGRDSGFAPPHHWSLSNALKFTLLP
jgi:hypothetical protein